MLNYGNRKWNKSLPKREREMEINCEIWGVLLRGVVLRGDGVGGRWSVGRSFTGSEGLNSS